MAKSTKQLAWELGLLRKRPLVESPSRLTKRRQLSDGQTFSYLIVIDFESTCWENDKYSPQEIIEFPAVLLNTKTGEIESEFHYYLQPTERPTLSDFCKQLTGIKQEMVDNGIPLYNCLRKFTAWLNKLKAEKGVVCDMDTPSNGGDKLTAFVTWSDWDLGVCLQYETKRKQVLKPSVLNRWIDLRKTYKEFYTRKPDGLSGALKDLGILFDGREHSGLDDARNTAKLAWRMLCDGCEMKITKIMKTNGLQTPLNSETHTLSVSHLKVANVPFQIAVDQDTPTIAKLPIYHLQQKVSSANNSTPQTKLSCETNKRVLTNTTNVIDSKLKTQLEMRRETSPTKGENSKIVQKQYSSKLPVLQTNWKKLDKENNQPNSKTFTKIQSPSPSLCCQNANNKNNKRSSSSVTPLNNLTSSTLTTGCALSSLSTSAANTTPKAASYTTPTNTAAYTTPTAGNTTPTAAYTIPITTAAYTTPAAAKTTPSTGYTTPTTTVAYATPTTMAVYTTPTGAYTTPTGVPKSHNNNGIRLAQTRHHTSPRLSTFTALKPKRGNVSLSDTSNFKTPTAVRLNHSVQSAFKKPNSSMLTDMKRTPPLCSCGRRSKRRLVQNQGPNQGRWFFTCSVSSYHDKAKAGCTFFLWENPCSI